MSFMLRAYLFHIEGSLCGGLRENEIIFLSEAFAFLEGNLTPSIKVAFISNEHDRHVGVAVLSHLLEPLGQVIESITSTEYINR